MPDEAPIVAVPAVTVPDAVAAIESPIDSTFQEPVTPTPEIAETPAKPEPTAEELEKRREARRIDRERKSGYKQAAEQKARADFYERELEKARQATTQAPAPLPGALKIEDFNFDPEAYAQAVAKQAADKTANDIQTRQQQQAAQAAETQMVADWESKVDKAHEKYDDFAAAVGDLTPTTPWAIALMRLENGTDVAYHLGKDAVGGGKEARRIAALDPISQILEIGRLSAKLATQQPEVKLPSNTPAPIRPVAGSSAPTVKKLSDLDQDAFEKRRRAQIALRR